MMKEFLVDSVFFGAVLSLAAYEAGALLKIQAGPLQSPADRNRSSYAYADIHESRIQPLLRKRQIYKLSADPCHRVPGSSSIPADGTP